MAAALRPVRPRGTHGAAVSLARVNVRGHGWWIPAALYGGPLGAALVLGVGQGFDGTAWARLLADSQFPRGLALAVGTGMAATTASTGLALAIVTRWHGTRAWRRLEAWLAPMLAIPHAAFAIGLSLLLMPSGLLVRLAAPLWSWNSPPDIVTTQDPWGLTLVLALVLKEAPFLLWSIAAQLARTGQGAELERQLQAAATMGYSRRRAWQRVLWPQLLPRLALPLLAVWSYSLTVVDMALVIGPTNPPTLAVLAWQWMLDADPSLNAQGAAAALLLTAAVAVGAFAAWAVVRATRALRARRWTRGDRGAARIKRGRGLLIGSMPVIYAAVLAMLLWMSFAQLWTFPAWWPQRTSGQAWQTALHSGNTLAATVELGVLSALAGLALAVAWMEATPARFDAWSAPALFAPMLVPGVLLVGGLYRLALHAGLDGRMTGLWLSHTLYVAPYVLVVLAPAYRSFDPRYAQTVAALGRTRAAFLCRVKWPMLASPLAAAFAVGFAVSVAQYLPTQFVGAGRHATLTTEALTLAAGGQRSLAAAFALLQAALPAAVFAAAWAFGRRRSERIGDRA